MQPDRDAWASWKVEEGTYADGVGSVEREKGFWTVTILSLSLAFSLSPSLIDLLWFAGLPSGSSAWCSVHTPPPSWESALDFGAFIQGASFILSNDNPSWAWTLIVQHLFFPCNALNHICLINSLCKPSPRSAGNQRRQTKSFLWRINV